MDLLLLLLFLALVVGVPVVASSRHPAARLLARGVLLLLAVGSALACLAALQVGFANGWTSDGPGMLLVMLAVPVFGAMALFFGSTFLASLAATPEEE